MGVMGPIGIPVLCTPLATMTVHVRLEDPVAIIAQINRQHTM